MTFTQGLALVVGVSAYKYEPRLNVPVALRDANAVSEVLLDRQYCGYLESQVIALSEEQTTREHILEALDRVASRAERDNTVFIFFCGHGDYGTDGSYYLLCHDSRLDGNKVIAGMGIRQDELLQKLRSIKSQRLVMVFNSCHSGEISPSLSIDETFGGRTLPVETAEALLATGSGRILITACREGQLSWIGRGDLSIFTQALKDAMQGKDLIPRGGFISVFDLYTALFQNVSSKVHDLLGVEQEPELTILKGVGPFAVALFRGATQTHLGAAEEAVEPPQRAAVRCVEPERSNRMYQKITGQSGGIHFGQGNVVDVQGGVAGRDKIDINTGGGAYVGRNVIVHGGDFVGRDQFKTASPSADEMTDLFEKIFARIESHPGLSQADKEDLKAEVVDVKADTSKAGQIDESVLIRRLRNIGRIAPDILDVVLATLVNPAAGFVVVARKVAEKVKSSSS
jgi:hypothetical protein